MDDEEDIITEADGSDPLERIQVRRHLEEVNRFLLAGAGELMEAPGKISLVWTDPVYAVRRYLSVKASGDHQILVNGKRYPATEPGLKQALVTCIKDFH